MKCVASLLLASLAITMAADPVKYTQYETDVDYVKNDIGSVKEKDFHDCVKHCDPAQGCGAFSWNNYEDGTCWLKSGRGDKIAKKGVTSTIVSLTPLACVAVQDVDYIDNDVGNLPGKADECCDKCQKTNNCYVYVWTDFNGGTCWFKSKRGQAVYKKGAVAGDVWSTPAPTNVHYVDWDFVAHDLASQWVGNNVDACYDKCKNYAGCRAFTWTNHQGGTCWLKANYDAMVSKAGAVGGVGPKTLVKELRKLDAGKDLYDGDFKNVAPVPVKEDCIQICADEAACKSVAWNDYKNGTCWLKTRNDKNGNIIDAPGVQTYIVKEL